MVLTVNKGRLIFEEIEGELRASDSKFYKKIPNKRLETMKE